jgi:hypothetical protein
MATSIAAGLGWRGCKILVPGQLLNYPTGAPRIARWLQKLSQRVNAALREPDIAPLKCHRFAQPEPGFAADEHDQVAARIDPCRGSRASASAVAVPVLLHQILPDPLNAQPRVEL